MEKVMLQSKIHRATVTGADLHYEGSITVDSALMEKAGLIEYEQVHIYDVSNGERFQTYVITGPRNSGTICINGAAARKVAKGDLIIIASYVSMDAEEAKRHQPKLVFVDERNRPKARMSAVSSN
ncbi:MAG TPA: aspartate 1-decarboxylase [Thermodesulfobacteriota bacterium]|nr:aspartate 1-decarboxylase [Deltaproteobacteria bacterium]HNR13593.1 aspartate 1-decarboxylase [Thermodesulfobacteriota bacterium]HNU72063.1 aspartate 1-decarboxylase [Thermodesulfobacteriota bacterium]HQO78352.1 aspartate 1-decarboxylase [Thermodesulfobacteriota bacterium]